MAANRRRWRSFNSGAASAKTCAMSSGVIPLWNHIFPTMYPKRPRFTCMATGPKPAIDPIIQADIEELRASNETRRIVTDHLDHGDAYLAELQLEQAIAEFRLVIELFRHPRPTGAPSTALGTFAAERIAWTYAAMGDFRQAANWLDLSTKEHRDPCGVYQANWATEVTMIQRVWLTASLQPGEAEPQLRRLADRQLPWGAKPLTNDKRWNRKLLGVGSREASLVLGVYLFKTGQTASAKAYLSKAAAHSLSKREGWFVLATSYLRQIKAKHTSQALLQPSRPHPQAQSTSGSKTFDCTGSGCQPGGI